MSANLALAHQLHDKAQIKSPRAGTAASWFAIALDWVVEAFTQPLSPEFDIGAAPRSPQFPAFHC